MTHRGRRTARNRGKNARQLTIREIKAAICTHDTLAPLGPSELQADGVTWHTKVSCPTCGAWSIRETPDAVLGMHPTEEPAAVVAVA